MDINYSSMNDDLLRKLASKIDKDKNVERNNGEVKGDGKLTGNEISVFDQRAKIEQPYSYGEYMQSQGVNSEMCTTSWTN